MKFSSSKKKVQVVGLCHRNSWKVLGEGENSVKIDCRITGKWKIQGIVGTSRVMMGTSLKGCKSHWSTWEPGLEAGMARPVVTSTGTSVDWTLGPIGLSYTSSPIDIYESWMGYGTDWTGLLYIVTSIGTRSRGELGGSYWGSLQVGSSSHWCIWEWSVWWAVLDWTSAFIGLQKRWVWQQNQPSHYNYQYMSRLIWMTEWAGPCIGKPTYESYLGPPQTRLLWGSPQLNSWTQNSNHVEYHRVCGLNLECICRNWVSSVAYMDTQKHGG